MPLEWKVSGLTVGLLFPLGVHALLYSTIIFLFILKIVRVMANVSTMLITTSNVV